MLSFFLSGMFVGTAHSVALSQQPHVIPADTFFRGSWNRVKITRLSADLRTSLHSEEMAIGDNLESLEKCLYSPSTGSLLLLEAQFRNLGFGDFVWTKSFGLTKLVVPSEWMVVDYTIRGDLVAALCWRPLTFEEHRQRKSEVFNGMLGVLYWKNGAWSKPFSVQEQGSFKEVPGFPWVSFLTKLAWKSEMSRERFDMFLLPRNFENSWPSRNYGCYTQESRLFYSRRLSPEGVSVYSVGQELKVRPYCVVRTDCSIMAVRFISNNLYLLDSDQNFSLVSRSGALLSSCKVKAIVDIVE